MNEMSNTFNAGLPTSPDELLAGLQDVNAAIKTTGGVPFMRLLKSGAFAYGPESIEPELGSLWAVNPYSIAHGFVCWGDGSLLDERMVPFNHPPPQADTLPNLGFPWDAQVAVTLQCMSGEDEGVSVLYKGSSTGFRSAVKGLINELMTKLASDKVNIVPVITLEVDSYQHKKYGEVFTPLLNVHEWVSMDGISSATDSPDGGADDGVAGEEVAEPSIEEEVVNTRKKETASSDSEPSNRRARRRARPSGRSA